MYDRDKIESIIPVYESFLQEKRDDYLNHIIKYRKMQDRYIGKNLNLYSKEQLQEINDSYDGLTQKILYTLIQLDKNWAMHGYHTMKNLHYLENPPETAEWNQTDLIIFNMFIETYLLLSRSLLDSYMRHVTLVSGKKNVGLMRVSKFKRQLRSVDSAFTIKGEAMLDYFEKKVFGEKRWGSLLRKWRDQIAHGKNINLRYQEPEDSRFLIHLYWPTLEGEPFFDFCQMVYNGIFDMICDTSQLLFDIEWQAGPHNQIT